MITGGKAGEHLGNNIAIIKKFIFKRALHLKNVETKRQIWGEDKSCYQ